MIEYSLLRNGIFLSEFFPALDNHPIEEFTTSLRLMFFSVAQNV